MRLAGIVAIATEETALTQWREGAELNSREPATERAACFAVGAFAARDALKMLWELQLTSATQ